LAFHLVAIHSIFTADKLKKITKTPILGIQGHWS